MSEKTLRIFLEDLKKLRIVCQNKDCGGVSEIAIDKSGAPVPTQSCPFCAQQFRAVCDGGRQILPIRDLIAALNHLRNDKSIKIEFPVEIAD